MGRQFHACTHTTFAPTVIHGGTKTNVIPDTVDLEIAWPDPESPRYDATADGAVNAATRTAVARVRNITASFS